MDTIDRLNAIIRESATEEKAQDLAKRLQAVAANDTQADCFIAFTAMIFAMAMTSPMPAEFARAATRSILASVYKELEEPRRDH